MESDFLAHALVTTSWALDDVFAGVVRYQNERSNIKEDLMRIAIETVGESRIWERTAPYDNNPTGQPVCFAVIIEMIVYDMFDI